MPDAPRPLTLEYAPPAPRAPRDGRVALLLVNWAAAGVSVAMTPNTWHVATCGVANCSRVPHAMLNGMTLFVAVVALGGCSARWLWLSGPDVPYARRRAWRVGLLAPVGLMCVVLLGTVVALGVRPGT